MATRGEVSSTGRAEIEGREGVGPGGPAPILACEDLTVDFGLNRAVDGVTLSIWPGEIVGLVGPNGAGKSTLGRVFVGELPRGAYQGTLRVNGETVQFRDARAAHHAGVTLIHQEGAAIGQLSIGENVMLTLEPTRNGRIDWPALHGNASRALAQLGVHIDTRARLADSGGIALEEMVEIARSIVRGSRLFVFDESTAALGAEEIRTLLSRMRELAARGAGIVFISHRIDEVLSVCDRIVVLRDGRIVLDKAREGQSYDSIVRAMLGIGPLDEPSQRGAAASGAARAPAEAPALELADWRVPRSDLCRVALGPIDAQVHPGEILGVFGPLGAGKTELLSSLFGLYGAAASGELRLDGRVRRGARGPAEAIRRGLAFVTADRQKEGLIPQLSVQDNMLLGYHRSGLARRGVLDRDAGRERCRALIKELSIQTLGPEQPVSALSGGNQQKVLLARALLNAPRVLLLDEPTRGIDVGAKRDVYRLIKRIAAEGAAIICSSMEEDELLGLAHRILVVRDGRQLALLDAATTTQHDLLTLAAGGELG
ncbi:MAG: sugar ABC transporter ATP-binding protein [Alphaproteobacteria bacterium]